MRFEAGDATDLKLVDVLCHEFRKCVSAFEKFVLYTHHHIIGGDASSEVKSKCYDSYIDFLTSLYEFYVGCYQRQQKTTASIPAHVRDRLFNSEAEKLMRNRRERIRGGYADEWENHISYYEEEVPEEFGRDFRTIRNSANHTLVERARCTTITLKEFKDKYHKFLYLLYDSARFSWSNPKNKDYKIDHIESFDLRPNNDKP